MADTAKYPTTTGAKTIEVPGSVQALVRSMRRAVVVQTGLYGGAAGRGGTGRRFRRPARRPRRPRDEQCQCAVRFLSRLFDRGRMRLPAQRFVAMGRNGWGERERETGRGVVGGRVWKYG